MAEEMPEPQPHIPSAEHIPSTDPSPKDLPNTNSQSGTDGQRPDTTPEWTFILDAMTKHDEQMILNWKDDLSNLLVFAGLFSSVVTGFVVASYPWLQPAGPDPFLQVQLLAQISGQLASLSVSPGFINSTAQPSPSLTVPPSSGPTNVQILINTLWFLSLGLGLVTSLLAIVVLQWLREYRVPGYLTVRDRVRLRQLRYQGLIKWGVPQIVSILPVLLQVALILFLTGLCDLLESLNKPVYTAFIVFVGSALAIYSAFAILPVIFSQCPYRSALADLMIRTCSLILGITLTCVMTIVFALSLLFINIYFFFADWILLKAPVGSRAKLMQRRVVKVVVHFASKPLPQLAKILLTFGRNEHSWLARDARLLMRSRPVSVDADVLIWSPHIVERDDRPKLDVCLQDLSLEQRSRCIVSWAAQALGTQASMLADHIAVETHPLHNTHIKRINHAFVDRFQVHLRDAFLLPGQYSNGLIGGSTNLVLLVMLRQSIVLNGATVESDFVQRYTRGIMSLRRRQTSGQIKTAQGWVRLPTQCLFECSTRFQYAFSREEISQTFVFALEMQDLLHPFHLINYQFRLDCLELILLSAATALTAVCRTAELLQGSTLADQCRKMLLGLGDVLEHNQRYTRRGANRPTSWIQRLSKRQLQSAIARRQISLRSISPAIVKLSHCLVYLRRTDALPEILSHGRGPYGSDISVSSLQVAMLNAFPLSELGLRPMCLEANEHIPNPGNSDFRGSSQSRVNNDADTTYRETLPILSTTGGPLRENSAGVSVAVSSETTSESITDPPPDIQLEFPIPSIPEDDCSHRNAALDPGDTSATEGLASGAFTLPPDMASSETEASPTQMMKMPSPV